MISPHTRRPLKSRRTRHGLAFHPLHQDNGRFFVFYTRVGDGTLVVAEYGLTGNPDVANPAETVILTMPHSSFTNHNGGMLAFGPDTFLYIGVGDGGGANDPPSNAQNINVLLGKLLRIDVDTPHGGDPYSSPSTNLFWNDERRGRDLRVWPSESVAIQLRPRLRATLARRRGTRRVRGG